jgi:hypothetical protein
MPGSTRLAVFVAPFFAETTLRFVRAAANLPDVQLVLLSQDPLERLPTEIRHKLTAHHRLTDALDAGQIGETVGQLTASGHRVDRLLGALEELQLPLARVRERFGIEGMGTAAALNFRDKSRMKDVLRAADIPCARHGLAHDADEARRIVDSIGFPLVLKPPAGAAARNTFRVDDATSMEQLLSADPPSKAQPVLIEEFIVGREHSFDAVSIGGKLVWHSLTRYTPGPLEVLRQPWVQWTVLLPREVDHPRYDDIRSVGARTLQALGMQTGLSHMEWFRREDGTIAVSEVAARPPGAQFTTLISYAHEIDFYHAWARLMILDRFDPPRRRYAAGIAFLRGQGTGRVRAISGLDQAQEELGELVVETRLPRPDQTPGSTYEGEGYVVLRHPRTEVVERGLARLVTLVRVELG